MGILADFFVATLDDALLYETRLHDEEELPAGRYEVVQYKRLMSLQIGTLWALLLGEDWDVKRHKLIHIAHSEEGETCLDQFPSPLVALLAEQQDSALPSISAAWGATEEMEWPPDEAIPVLEELRRLARLAQARGQGVYLWNCI